MRLFAFLCLFIFTSSAVASEKIVNVYAWTGEIPDTIVRQFEKETGIKINFSTYENNEVMYAKMKAVKHNGYDVIMPSSYFVDRMQKQDLLQPLDHSQLPNWQHINQRFRHPAYDKQEAFSVPYIWGVTGIFYNDQYYTEQDAASWQHLWDKKFYNQLMLLDDSREVFSMALIANGHSANDKDLAHIKSAYEKLLALLPNIKVFSTETVVSIMIDEDARIGMSWNGDAYKASLENPHVKFVFPKEGFVIWVDNFAIPKNPPHLKAAYTFINFMMRPDIAKEVALQTRFPIANKTAQGLLPADIRNNPLIFPANTTLQRGQFQSDLGEQVLSRYDQYWTQLKMR